MICVSSESERFPHAFMFNSRLPALIKRENMRMSHAWMAESEYASIGVVWTKAHFNWNFLLLKRNERNVTSIYSNMKHNLRCSFCCIMCHFCENSIQDALLLKELHYLRIYSQQVTFMLDGLWHVRIVRCTHYLSFTRWKCCCCCCCYCDGCGGVALTAFKLNIQDESTCFGGELWWRCREYSTIVQRQQRCRCS